MTDEQPKSPWLPIIRELYAGILAVVVLGLFLTIVLRALPDGSGNSSIEPVKDLLAIVNPMVGLVIGYYFSRVTTEARAERAESAADVGIRTATEAVLRQTAAERRAGEAAVDSTESRHALRQLREAAEEAFVTANTANESEATFQASAKTTQRPLERALAAAERVLARNPAGFTDQSV